MQTQQIYKDYFLQLAPHSAYHSELGRWERSDLARWERSDLARSDLYTIYNNLFCLFFANMLLLSCIILKSWNAFNVYFISLNMILALYQTHWRNKCWFLNNVSNPFWEVNSYLFVNPKAIFLSIVWFVYLLYSWIALEIIILQCCAFTKVCQATTCWSLVDRMVEHCYLNTV